MTELTSRQLDGAVGGAKKKKDSFGRCGPGSRFQKLFGNYFTPACKRHDQAVRDAMNGGASYLEAQIEALPELPAAAASWWNAKFG